jgi:transcriptional regulator with XRE-family HTH domain
MSGPVSPTSAELAGKIARLVEERGWNQEDFARIAGLNRHTVRQIMVGETKRRLRNTTVNQCAQALGLTVSELRNLPLDRLLPRMHGRPAGDDESLRKLYEFATQQELRQWIDRNPDRARRLGPAEIEELLALQGDGGPLAKYGVEHFIDRIERKRELMRRVETVAGTEYLEFLERFVGLIYDKVQPGGGRE